MKKRVWSMFLCVSLLFGMVACSKQATNQPVNTESGAATEVDGQEEEQRSNVIETDEETGEQYYLLGDFENYFECSNIKYTGSFGKITQVKKSEEPEMVTYGNQSAKFDIFGSEETWFKIRPSMGIDVNSGFFNLTSNFSNMSKFTFDIYNGQDYEVTIRVCNGDGEERAFINDNYDLCKTIKVELQPKSWTHVEIPAEEFMSIKYDNSAQPYLVYGAEALEEVRYLLIMFDRGELHENGQVYYVDNVRAYLKNE